MSEFFRYPVITPQSSDELLFVRNRRGTRATVSQLLSSLNPSGEPNLTPPTDPNVLTWVQGTSGSVIGLWQRTATGLWVSQEIWLASVFSTPVNADVLLPAANPCPGQRVWIDSFTARARVQNTMASGEYVDFQLNLLDIQSQQTPIFYLRLQGGTAGSLCNLSEPVGQVTEVSNALALWLRTKRQGSTKLEYVSMAVAMRRIYATS